jgi:hypothetical protein
MIQGQSRGSLLARLERKVEPQKKDESEFWEELCGRVKKASVIPVVSNALIYECIFGCQADPNCPTLEEQLAQLWAGKLNYPLSDKGELARVAQYSRVAAADPFQAKGQYLQFLKEILIEDWADKNNAAESQIRELISAARDYSFSDMARELGYEERLAPLQKLANLPVSIYITTSPHDFLELALLRAGRKSRTQVCYWTGDVRDVIPDHITDYNLRPTPENPLVYHLLGLECYPTTLVLSEDDYLDFIVSISKETGARNPYVPFYLREALTTSSLVLLGYHLRDWDFRVLFRGLIYPQPSNLRWFSLIIQLSPEREYQINNLAEARRYLENYFAPTRFRVEWTQAGSESFLERLWKEWQQWR